MQKGLKSPKTFNTYVKFKPSLYNSLWRSIIVLLVCRQEPLDMSLRRSWHIIVCAMTAGSVGVVWAIGPGNNASGSTWERQY